MVPESEKRAAHLAVSRFGAEPVRVQELYQQVLKTRAKGESADLLDILVQQHLLTSGQAQELRAGLDVTHIDTTARRPSGNGDSAPVAARSSELNAIDLRQVGNYRILRRLGEGGMGSVYLGYQEGDRQQVAIKVLPEHLAGNQAAIDRFYREAKSGALLNHPNIVRNLAVGQDKATSRHYLVMEFVDGPSALELLHKQGRLSVGDAVHIILDVARALEHAHSRNIVHRDIKPDNILINQSGVAKLSDLGLAKRTDEASHLTANRQGFGTPYYMPYEQAMNAKHADGRSDIYALGATLYHLVTGEVPFPGSSHVEIVEKKEVGIYPPASSHNAKVPAVLDAILDRMLAREPAERYQTVSELIVDLERSGLAAAVPSFIDPDRAMQDPLVRERLTTPAQATAPDMQMPEREPKADARKGNPDIWYLRYQDQSGRWCKAKATTEQVLKRLRERRFTTEVEASHHHNGDFVALGKLEEFKSAVAELLTTARKRRGSSGRLPILAPEAVKAPIAASPFSASRLWLFTSVGVVVGLAAGAVVVKLVLGL
jgi:serine/threonine protein kinase